MSKEQLSMSVLLANISRWLLAAIGGYSSTILLCAFASKALSQWFSVSKASVLMWMLLLSFLIYAGIVIWVVATRHLTRSFFIIVVANLVMFGWLKGAV